MRLLWARRVLPTRARSDLLSATALVPQVRGRRTETQRAMRLIGRFFRRLLRRPPRYPLVIERTLKSGRRSRTVIRTRAAHEALIAAIDEA